MPSKYPLGSDRSNFDESDLSYLNDAAAKMGISPDQIHSTLMNPSAVRRIMETLGRAESSGASGSGAPTKESSYFEQMVASLPRLMEQNFHDQRLHPEKMPLMDRSDVLNRIGQARSTQGSQGGPSDGKGVMIKQTSIGTHPFFSKTPIEQLQKVSLSDLYVRKVHKGQFLLCRIITPSASLVAVNYVIEDPAGDVMTLSLYNYPCTLGASHEELDVLLPIGTILGIREPYLKVATHGGMQAIRVDSPSNIVILDADHAVLKDVRWSTGIRLAGAHINPTTANGWKERGVSQFKAKRWLCAAICFSEALKLDPNHTLSRLNRAEAYLRLEWFGSAISDSEIILKTDLKDENLLRKAVFRAAKASYYLRDYDRTLEVAGLRSNDTEISAWKEKAEQRIQEKTTGHYDWCFLFHQSQSDVKRIDAADFTGPIEVKFSKKRKGVRGSYATRDIEIGELLMVAKPIACVYPEDNPRAGKEVLFSMNFLTKSVKRYTQTALINKIAQSMWDNPDVAHKLDAMYAGPSLPKPSPFLSSRNTHQVLDHALKPVCDIDVARIEAVVSFNSFRPHPPEEPSKLVNGESDTSENDAEDKPTALYFCPALCNHSCLPSARYTFFGDIMVVRACQAIKRGEEITLEYWSGAHSLAYREKRNHWGFDCTCLLCAADRIDGEDASELRSRLAQDSSFENMSVPQAKALIARINSTYKDTPERKQCGTRPDAALAYGVLGAAYTMKIMQNPSLAQPAILKQCIQAGMTLLAATGMVVTDKTLSGPVHRNATDLPVDTKRGPTHHKSICTFHALKIADTFKYLQDTRRACDWMKVAAWLENISLGGGKELFLLRYGACLSDWGMKDLALLALKD